MNLSAYRCMWLIAMFDLPVETTENRRDYVRFRKALLKDGFMMLQFSVYARFIPSEEAAEAHRQDNKPSHSSAGTGAADCVTDHPIRQNGGILWEKTARARRKFPSRSCFFEARAARTHCF